MVGRNYGWELVDELTRVLLARRARNEVCDDVMNLVLEMHVAESNDG